MKLVVTAALSALILSGPALAQTPVKPPIYASRPNGDGDPNAISCYAGLETTSRIYHKQCKSNAEWARIHAAIHNQCGGCGSFAPSSAPIFPR